MLKLLITDSSLYESIVRNAGLMVREKHSIEQETTQYQRLLDEMDS